MTYSLELSARYLDLARTPISKEHFAGDDIRFSNEYEAVESELGKAHSLHENSRIDWQKILDDSELILRDHSKDLRVAVWLAWALYQKNSFAGLLAGFGLLHHLCKDHWECLHPLKSRTRVAAFNWLLPRLEQVLAESVPIK